MVFTIDLHPQVGEVNAVIFVTSPVAKAMLRSVKKACAVARTLAATSFDDSAAGVESAALVGVPAVDALSLEALTVADGCELAAIEFGGVLGPTEGATATGEEASGASALGWLAAVQPESRARLIIAAAKAVRRSPTRATVREQRAAF